MSEQYTYELYHHGIKGMKWGIRRTPKQLGHNPSSSKKKLTVREKAKLAKAEAKAKAKAATKDRSKSVKDMTDEQLAKAVERKKMEENYYQLYPEKNRGKRFANSMLDDAIIPGIVTAGKTLVTNALTKFGDKFLDTQVKKYFPEVDNGKSISEQIKKLEESAKLKELMDKELQQLKRDATAAKYRATINDPKAQQEKEDNQ